MSERIHVTRSRANPGGMDVKRVLGGKKRTTVEPGAAPAPRKSRQERRAEREAVTANS